MLAQFCSNSIADFSKKEAASLLGLTEHEGSSGVWATWPTCIRCQQSVILL